MITFLSVVQLIISIGLITAVVLQDSKAEGMGAIGGGGSKMFFSKSSAREELFSKATKYLAITFLVLSVVLSIVH